MIKAGDKVRRIGPDFSGVVNGGIYKVRTKVNYQDEIQLIGFGNAWFDINLFEEVDDIIYRVEQKHPFGGWVFLEEFDSKEEAIKEVKELDYKNMRVVEVVAEYEIKLKVY